MEEALAENEDLLVIDILSQDMVADDKCLNIPILDDFHVGNKDASGRSEGKTTVFHILYN